MPEVSQEAIAEVSGKLDKALDMMAQIIKELAEQRARHDQMATKFRYKGRK